MDTEKLVAAAVAAVVGTLTKQTTESVVAAGGKVWAWIKGKVDGTEDASTVTAVEADPRKASARTKVTALLQDLLHDNPAAAKELADLLGGEAGVQAITQSASVSGNENTTNQIAGSGNTVNITHR
jgi:hypothetical protein